MSYQYDAIVIGAGPGGYPCAIRLAQHGKKVLIVESGHLGGLCLNWGCIPTKALAFAAEMPDNLKNARRMGFQIESRGVDLNVLQNWKDGIVKRLRSGIEILFKSNNVECRMGKAMIVSEHEVRIESESVSEIVSADYIVIATGSDVFPLPGFEYDHEYIIDTTDALALTSIPKSMLVIGAGASGLEMANIYANFDCKVTVVEILNQILPGMESELCESLHKILTRKGMSIHTASQAVKYERTENGMSVTLSIQGREEIQCFDRVLVTVGRKPNTAVCEGVGIEFDDRGYIVVNDFLETKKFNIFAIGDVIGPPLLAHKATAQGVQVADYIAVPVRKPRIRTIPSCVFTIPPLASAGLTEKEAFSMGCRLRIGRFPYRASGKALTMGESEGMVKVIADDRDNILGIHILGAESPSLIGEAVLAIDNNIKIENFVRSIHPHPTLTETLVEAVENIEKKAIHIPNTDANR